MEVGMNNWTERRLKDICIKITDGTHKTPKYASSGIIFLSAKNVKGGSLNFNECKYITLEEHQQLIKRCKPEEGDVMLSKSGSLGDAIVIPRLPYDFSIFESLALIKVHKDIVSPLYIKQYFNSPLSKCYFRSITSGVAVKHLHLIDLRRMTVIIPAIEIQNLIVEFLEKWDEAIEKTSKLIKAKKEGFEWLQDLLLDTRKNKKWQTSRLSEVSKIKKGEQLNRSELEDSGDYPAWNGGLNPSGYTDKWNILENTITISEGGNSCGFVNYCEQKFWCGGHCYALLDVSKGVDSEFLYYFLKSNEKRIMRLRVGSGLPNIQKKDIDKLEISYPELALQKQIAKTLNTAKKEIIILEEILVKYKNQKNGLMQKLLTGKLKISNKKEFK